MDKQGKVSFKKLWGKNHSIVKTFIDKDGYCPGNIYSRQNLGYTADQVEFLHYFSTKWRPKS